MSRIRNFVFQFIFLAFSSSLWAQTDTSDNSDLIDYSSFSDASGVKRYATQKVINQSPTRIVSLGYEYQGSFIMPDIPQDASIQDKADNRVVGLSGPRVQVNIPVISNDKLIWQLGGNYWGSSFRFKEQPASNFERILQDNGLQTIGIQSTVFKPIDEKHWLVIQVTGDWNSSFSKKSENISK